MSQPDIAAKQAAVLTLEPGSYYWCACGRSKKQPFCDGSHEGTEFEPQPFTITESKKVALCQCKRTDTSPYCDGSHKHL